MQLNILFNDSSSWFQQQDTEYGKSVIPLKQNKVRKWDINQNKIYANFLSKHQQMFETQFSRRSNKVYDRLARDFENRTVTQCKSHHQKMMKRLRSINNIIKNFLPEEDHILYEKTISTIKKEECDSINNWEQNNFRSSVFLEEQSIFDVIDFSPRAILYEHCPI